MTDEARNEFVAIARGARRLIERERAAGAGELLAASVGAARAARPAPPRGPDREPAAASEAAESMFEQATANAPPPGMRGANRPLHPIDAGSRAAIDAESRPLLDAIAREVKACQKCALFGTRTQAVPGVGSALSGIAFVGEGPGADEDRLGEPFVGRAGQLLDRILEAMNEAALIPGLKLDRSTVFIGNIVHCRPPENRVPLPAEVEQSFPYLKRQLAALKPRIICCLGKTAAEAMLGVKSALGPLRGRTHSWGDSKVVVTYHPAACLRNPGYKRPVWEDMQFLAREYLTD